MRGNWEKLQFLILSFAEKNSGADSKLEELLNNHRFLEAQQMLHQIKGSGANLGAVKISSIADGIEQCLKQGNLIIPNDLLVAFSSSVDELKKGKEILMSVKTSKEQNTGNINETKMLDKRQLDATLHTLQSNLTQDIALAEASVAKLIELCESTSFEAMAVKIKNHMNDFALDSISKDIGLYFQSNNSEGD